MSDDLRDTLRALPGFPDDLPTLDAASVPADPLVLFRAWLQDAINAGARQPHAFDLLTARGDGTPVGRVLIVKAIDARGLHFSTHATSRKGEQLAARPTASMLFFWREAGRTVRITGAVHPLSAEESAGDWEQRPTYTGAPNPDWTVYALARTEFEFMQARQDRRHVRIEYLLDADAWTHAPVASPAG